MGAKLAGEQVDRYGPVPGLSTGRRAGLGVPARLRTHWAVPGGHWSRFGFGPLVQHADVDREHDRCTRRPATGRFAQAV